MFDHIGIHVADLGAARDFYEATLAPLDIVLCMQDQAYLGFGPIGEPALWLYPHDGAAAKGCHLAFRAKSRAQVDAFHAAGLAAGAADNGAPGLRPDYGAHYYGAFLIDADGNNIEAVCHDPA